MTRQALTMDEAIAPGRAVRLRAATHAAHAALDARVMALDPFGSRANYARLLAVHYGFHRDIAPLYRSAALAALIDDLAARSRLAAIEQDYTDLGLALPDTLAPPRFATRPLDVPTALGWLYVAEGSALGAALLLKAAGRIGLDAGFGARHLAGHADGRAQHWRGFTAALDRVPLDAEAEARAIVGAEAAFARVLALVEGGARG